MTIVKKIVVESPKCFRCDAVVSVAGALCDNCQRNKSLTEERALITRDHVLEVLSRHIGADQGVTVTELARECRASAVDDLASHRHLRGIIEELRLEGHHVCAHPARGYYMAKDGEELEQTCRFLYSRAMASLKQVAAMKRVSLPDLEGQLNLRI